MTGLIQTNLEVIWMSLCKSLVDQLSPMIENGDLAQFFVALCINDQEILSCWVYLT